MPAPLGIAAAMPAVPGGAPAPTPYQMTGDPFTFGGNTYYLPGYQPFRGGAVAANPNIPWLTPDTGDPLTAGYRGEHQFINYANLPYHVPGTGAVVQPIPGGTTGGTSGGTTGGTTGGGTAGGGAEGTGGVGIGGGSLSGGTQASSSQSAVDETGVSSQLGQPGSTADSIAKGAALAGLFGAGLMAGPGAALAGLFGQATSRGHAPSLFGSLANAIFGGGPDTSGSSSANSLGLVGGPGSVGYGTSEGDPGYGGGANTGTVGGGVMGGPGSMGVGESAGDPGYGGGADAGSDAGSPAGGETRRGGQVRARGGLISYAKGGGISDAYRYMAPGHSGLVRDDSPGRADKVLTRVPVGSYILPADVVSHLGHGNTDAGERAVHRFIERSPKMAAGGDVPMRDVYLSGGEFRIPHEVVRGHGKGDMEKGARYLDGQVLAVRRAHIKHLKGLPGPKK